MDYYEWWRIPAKSDRANHPVCIVTDVISGNEIIDCTPLRTGTSIKEWNSSAKGLVRNYGGSGDLLDSLVCMRPIMIVSARALECFKDLPDVQLLPITLVMEGKETDIVYYLVNPLKKLDCIDLSQTPHRIDEAGQAERTDWRKQWVLRVSAIEKDAPIFRLSQDLLSIIVREDLKKDLEQSGLTGFNLLKLEVI